MPQPRTALSLSRLLDPGEPEDGVQVEIRADRGLRRRLVAPPREARSRVTAYELARPLLFALEPETAHRLGFHLARFSFPRIAACPVRAMGLEFPNPVGLAAGLDKDAAHIDALTRLGFGFIEVGTVTPRPQPGNPRPRLFRIVEKEALINRFGFNNVGVDAFMQNVERTRWRGILGINIGRNADTPPERAVEDYETGLEKVYAKASYVAINISSPNTKGLRDLQR